MKLFIIFLVCLMPFKNFPAQQLQFLIDAESIGSVNAISSIIKANFDVSTINVVKELNLFIIDSPALISANEVIQPLDKRGYGVSLKRKSLVLLKVDGIVCSFCLTGIQKTLANQPEVDSVDFDLNTGIISIHLKPEQTIDFDLVKAIIFDSGYEVKVIF